MHDSCRIQTAYYYGGSGGINDTANFFYTGTRLISVMGSGAGVLYTYNGDQLFSMAYSWRTACLEINAGSAAKALGSEVG